MLLAEAQLGKKNLCFDLKKKIAIANKKKDGSGHLVHKEAKG